MSYVVADLDSINFTFEYKYVDLGLSVNWASFNVGATKPEEYGDYFAWGETEPKTNYSWANYKFRTSGSYNRNIQFSKYNTTDYNGPVDNKTTLDPEDDVAHVKWGGSWRMPTAEEQAELRMNCDWTWYSSGNTEFNGVAGFKITSDVTGYTNRFIFLPAARFRYGTNLGEEDSGHYWSSSIDTDAPYYACRMGFSSGNYVNAYLDDRDAGRSIRPVRPSEEWLSSVSISYPEDNITMFVDGNTKLTIVVKQNGEVTDYIPFVKWSSDNPSVVVVDSKGVVAALSTGTAHITATVQSLSVQCTITVMEESNIDHEYVDLGLSVKWATFNVGATKPEEYGYYFAWGETKPKIDYNWTNYKFRTSGDSEENVKFSKYITDSDFGPVDNKTTLDPEDDVAHVIWGGSWRMPTKAEQDELYNNCTWTWYGEGNTEFNGVAGYKIISNVTDYTDRFIFLPAAGYRNYTGLYDVGSHGQYISSSLSNVYAVGSCCVVFYSSSVYTSIGSYRERGYSVRPVCP